jgi:hypothetical protein
MAMNENMWFRCMDAGPMLEWLATVRPPSERKLRLFVCSFLRTVWQLLPDEFSRQAVEVAERYADGHATRDELEEAQLLIPTVRDMENPGIDPTVERLWIAAADATEGDEEFWRPPVDELALDDVAEGAIQPPLLRDIFGNPFRPASVDPAWASSNGGTVRHLAAAIYEAKAFDRLPVLADALEDAGCSDPVILGHLRGPGPHVRGCWAVDLLLGKE